MRRTFLIAILLVGIAVIGFGYSFSRSYDKDAFMTAPVERGMVATYV
jgi:hypothetical protein